MCMHALCVYSSTIYRTVLWTPRLCRSYLWSSIESYMALRHSQECNWHGCINACVVRWMQLN